MKQVNMLNAKTHLSRLIADLEAQREEEIIIARNGTPVARLQGLDHPQRESAAHRIGAAKGAFGVPDDIDTPFGDLSTLFAASLEQEEANSSSSGTGDNGPA
ncbi:MAG: type II toxin-antitoxin system Phd/YefM family antitoxin [Alkalispirochaetaceae bacterium]